MSRSCPHLDKLLGIQEEVSRRDFLDGALLASGAALLAASAPVQMLAQAKGWTGYTGEGDYRNSAGNTEEVVHNAHSVRDGAWDKAPANVTDTGEFHDCVVVGGGFVLALSDVERAQTYDFCGVASLPVTDFQATLRVTPIVDGDRAFVEWWATFDCDAARRDELTGTLRASFGKWLNRCAARSPICPQGSPSSPP